MERWRDERRKREERGGKEIDMADLYAHLKVIGGGERGIERQTDRQIPLGILLVTSN